MTPTAHALLEHLFDYAGLFPPAALDVGDAADHYDRYRSHADAWMLGRFIAPAGRLADGEEMADLVGAQNGRPWRVSVLGAAPDEGEDWTGAALRTLSIAQSFEAETDGRAVCDRFEIRLPADLATAPDRLADALLALDEAYRQGGATGPRAALEVPFLDHPGTTAPAAQAVAEANARTGRPAFAVKLRCGGVTADLVPGVERLAGAIDDVVRAGAPFKATAGLHHPLPNHDDAVGARMHGFMGVFGGAILARLHGLDRDALAEVLDDADASHWSVGDELRWTTLSASAAEVADGRSQLALSFGSCSFDEPREDLRALGWI